MSRAESSAPRRVRFVSVASWIRAAVHCGFDVSPLLEQAGIAEQLRTDPMPLVRVDALGELMRACVERAGPVHHFPVEVGERFAFDHVPSLELFLTTCATPREALAALRWVEDLLPLLSIRFHEPGDGSAALEVNSGVGLPDAPPNTWFVEKDAVSIARFARTMLGEQATGHRVDLRHDPGAAVQQHLTERYKLPIRVGQPRNAIVFDAALLDRPLRGAMPALNLRACAQIAQELPVQPRLSEVETLEAWMLKDPALLREPLDGMAARLHVHPRTLQRRLDEAGLSFAALRDRCRRQLAEEALRHTDADLEALSERVGFADRQSFTRAFKRWTGLTPSAWRQVRRSG